MQVNNFFIILFQSQVTQFDAAVENYAEVKYLMNQFYKKAALKHGIYSDYVIICCIRNVSFDDGTEAAANRRAGVVGDLFENDILLTLPQAENLLKETNKRDQRQANIGPQYYWQKLTISYRFEVYDGNSSWKNVIRAALKHLEEQTCFRFQENGLDRDYLSYFRGSGCWSNVGRIGGRQQISIGNGCEHVGIVAHETLHALGLWHEQSRSDRDQYIYINYNNIYAGTQGNFERRSTANTDNMGQPYDLGSVMHYGSKAFTTDYNKYTILTRDSKYQQTMGQRGSISFKDAKMINLRYCQSLCPIQLNCVHGGYTDPNDCSKCRCPEGLGGTFTVSGTMDCGGDLYASSYYQTLKSPQFVGGMHCVWRIRSPAKVEVRVNSLSFPCLDTCDSYVELKYENNFISSGPKLCCTAPGTIISEGNDLIVILSLTKNINTQYTGFQLQFRTYGQPSVTLTPQPIFTTTPSTTTPYWSQWAAWSVCSVTCGGCGLKVRVRACYGGKKNCKLAFEEQPCGLEPCPSFANDDDCLGRILLPCDLMDQLKFETTKDSQVVLMDSSLLLLAQKKYEYSKKDETKPCFQKRFKFPCPSYALTLNIDWKQSSLIHKTRSSKTLGCCAGYEVRSGICVPRNESSPPKSRYIYP
uniref:Metalloendopeptidase n=1 Tax=Syphacia muris TaxID=451379 RepID=A0A0N5AT55_9BILA